MPYRDHQTPFSYALERLAWTCVTAFGVAVTAALLYGLACAIRHGG